MVVAEKKRQSRSQNGKPRLRETGRGGFVNTGFNLPPELYAALQSLARRDLTTLGSVIRQACARHVAAAGFEQ